MITIQFKKANHALKVYQLLLNHECYSTSLPVYLERGTESHLKIDLDEQHQKYIKIWLIPVIKCFITSVIEGNWIKEMIRFMFYFTDEEEQNQIMSITRSLVDGELTEVPIASRLTERECIIEKSLAHFITTSVAFSFESFLHFRLKEYRNLLLEYVEAAIDEYKLEQEYQNFIENLRSYVTYKETSFDTIHILHNKDFEFFDEHYQRFTKSELNRLIDPTITLIEEIDFESLIIAPLISMSPKEIYLYTNEHDHGVVQTIQKIFFERVQFYPKEAFYKLV